MNRTIEQLFDEQLASWSMARGNYAALEGVQTKELDVSGVVYRVQFNPARITSSSAKVDAATIKERKCFLCRGNLPKEQRGISAIEMSCRLSGNYTILVNPFPIFYRHLTIPEVAHTEQRIAMRFDDMLSMASKLTDYTLFYNGPKCGASAPDHAHFQAGNRGFMPIEKDWRRLVAGRVAQRGKASLLYLDDAPRATLVIESGDKEDAVAMFNAVYRSLPTKDADTEPMMNLLAWCEGGKWIVCIFPRAKHRPACYTAQGEENLLISPASVDLGGVFITPLEKDYSRIKAEDIMQILSEVCLTAHEMKQVMQRTKEILRTDGNR